MNLSRYGYCPMQVYIVYSILNVIRKKSSGYEAWMGKKLRQFY